MFANLPTYVFPSMSIPEFPDTLVFVDETKFNEIPAIKISALNYLEESQKMQNVTRLIFVRHGESSSNLEKSVAGRTLPTDLSEQGMIQVQRIAECLNKTNIQLDRIFNSPSLRTIRTAEQINSYYNVTMQSDDRLYDKWYGPFEGVSESEYASVKEKEETEIPRLHTFNEKFNYKAHPDMESMKDVYVRVSDFIEDIRTNHPGENILVTSHNGVMKSLFMADSAVHGYDLEYRAFDLDNCAIMVLELYPDKTMRFTATQGLKFKKNSKSS